MVNNIYTGLEFDKKKGEIIKKDNKTVLKHNQPCSGFFSTCTILLRLIISFLNTQKKLPDEIDCTYAFYWYKYKTKYKDLYKILFNENLKYEILYKNPIIITHDGEDQFSDYRLLNYSEISPFINKYFKMIKDIINNIEEKYNICYKNLCVIFHRGNDKIKECDIGNHDFYKEEIKKLNNNYKENLTFLIQSDETEFLNEFSNELSNNIVFWDEIRHIKKERTTVDKINFEHNNFYYICRFLAITIIMSKAKFIICNSGNCSLWILLYRGHFNGLIQYIDKKKRR